MGLRRHITRLYSDLRLLDRGLQSRLSTADLQERRIELACLDRAAGILPMRHSDLFFEFKTQITLTRARLDAASVEATEERSSAPSHRLLPRPKQWPASNKQDSYWSQWRRRAKRHGSGDDAERDGAMLRKLTAELLERRGWSWADAEVSGNR